MNRVESAVRNPCTRINALRHKGVLSMFRAISVIVSRVPCFLSRVFLRSFMSRVSCSLTRVSFFLIVFLLQNVIIPNAHARTAEKAMVVTAHPLATEVALRILKEGGNAVDAAICAQW